MHLIPDSNINEVFIKVFAEHSQMPPAAVETTTANKLLYLLTVATKNEPRDSDSLRIFPKRWFLVGDQYTANYLYWSLCSVKERIGTLAEWGLFRGVIPEAVFDLLDFSVVLQSLAKQAGGVRLIEWV